MTQKATAIIPADSPLLAWDVTGAVYQGPCPACQEITVVNRNIAKCDNKDCGRELTAKIVRPPLAERYMRITF